MVVQNDYITISDSAPGGSYSTNNDTGTLYFNTTTNRLYVGTDVFTEPTPNLPVGNSNDDILKWDGSAWSPSNVVQFGLGSSGQTNSVSLGPATTSTANSVSIGKGVNSSADCIGMDTKGTGLNATSGIWIRSGTGAISINGTIIQLMTNTDNVRLYMTSGYTGKQILAATDGKAFYIQDPATFGLIVKDTNTVVIGNDSSTAQGTYGVSIGQRVTGAAGALAISSDQNAISADGFNIRLHTFTVDLTLDPGTGTRIVGTTDGSQFTGQAPSTLGLLTSVTVAKGVLTYAPESPGWHVFTPSFDNLFDAQIIPTLGADSHLFTYGNNKLTYSGNTITAMIHLVIVAQMPMPTAVNVVVQLFKNGSTPVDGTAQIQLSETMVHSTIVLPTHVTLSNGDTLMPKVKLTGASSYTVNITNLIMSVTGYSIT